MSNFLLKRSFVTLLCLVFICSGMFYACGDDDDDNNDSSGDVFWPLEAGNSWTLEIYQDGVHQGTEVHTVTGTVSIRGTDVYRLVETITEAEQDGSSPGFSSPSGDTWEVFYYWKMKEDGLYEWGWGYDEEEEIYDSERLVMKYPVSAGESFDDGWGHTYTVKSLESDVTTPAGTFSCITYEARLSNGLVIEKNVSFGLGLVTKIHTRPENVYLYELTDYSL